MSERELTICGHSRLQEPCSLHVREPVTIEGGSERMVNDGQALASWICDTLASGTVREMLIELGRRRGGSFLEACKALKVEEMLKRVEA